VPLGSEACEPPLEGPVLITGAAGYVGSRLAERLLTGGTEVTAVVRKLVPFLDGCTQVVADLTASTELERIFSGHVAVVHLAGANEAVSRSDPEHAIGEAVSATWRVAGAAVAAGIPRVVYLSTAHVYGAAAHPGAVLTEQTVPEPRSAYSIARLACEHIAVEQCAQPDSATSVVCFRVTNAVGAPHDPAVDRWSLVANDLCRQAAIDGSMTLLSSGLQWRDFLHLEDVCLAVVFALGPMGLPRGTYNLASGVPLQVRELAVIVQAAYRALTGYEPALNIPPGGPVASEPHRYSTDALSEAGFVASKSVRSAVDETAQFCLEHRAELSGLPTTHLPGLSTTQRTLGA
jgi:UDP-glucose 4-epimerase